MFISFIGLKLQFLMFSRLFNAVIISRSYGLASRRHLEFVFVRKQASHGPEQSWPELKQKFPSVLFEFEFELFELS